MDPALQQPVAEVRNAAFRPYSAPGLHLYWPVHSKEVVSSRIYPGDSVGASIVPLVAPDLHL